MADHHATPSGPDLTQGIPAESLPDGGMLAGHIGDAAVLLARVGDEFFAVGATCTHYGGPLAEGLLVGDTVRCPWHHACFSLRTGEGDVAARDCSVTYYRDDKALAMAAIYRDHQSLTTELAMERAMDLEPARSIPINWEG